MLLAIFSEVHSASRDTESHIRVFGISENEIFNGGILQDPGDFLVEAIGAISFMQIDLGEATEISEPPAALLFALGLVAIISFKSWGRRRPSARFAT